MTYKGSGIFHFMPQKGMLVFLCLSSWAIGLSQYIEKEDLYQKWKLEKYREANEYYAPETLELDDFLHLKQDMRFEAITEGVSFTGTWMLNTNGAYIELKYVDGEREKLRIQSLTSFSLIITYDMEHYRYTEVHYHACEQ